MENKLDGKLFQTQENLERILELCTNRGQEFCSGSDLPANHELFNTGLLCFKHAQQYQGGILYYEGCQNGCKEREKHIQKCKVKQPKDYWKAKELLETSKQSNLSTNKEVVIEAKEIVKEKDIQESPRTFDIDNMDFDRAKWDSAYSYVRKYAKEVSTGGQCQAPSANGYGLVCKKPVDPCCINNWLGSTSKRCFECCSKSYGNLPETNGQRCKNPNHSLYQESQQAKQSRLQTDSFLNTTKQSEYKYPYSKDIPETKGKLKNAIKKDLDLLKEILPLDDSWLPDEDNTEMWSESEINDLEKECKKILTILKYLGEKLSIWEDDYSNSDEPNEVDEEEDSDGNDF